MLLAMKEPISPSTASWATLTPAPMVEVQATNRSCSPWVATRAEPTLPAPRSTWRTSESIAKSSRAERKDKIEAGKVSRARNSTPGIKCSMKVELYGSMFYNECFKRWFNLGCHKLCRCPGMAVIFAFFSIKEYKYSTTL